MRQSLSKPQTQKVIELRARQMRMSLMPSEQVLWNAINAGKLGVWFRRQVPILPRPLETELERPSEMRSSRSCAMGGRVM